MALRNGISLGIRKKYIRIENKQHWVKGVRINIQLPKHQGCDGDSTIVLFEVAVVALVLDEICVVV